MNNKDIKREFISKTFTKPYIHKYWEEKVNFTVNWDSVYYIINSIIPDNRIKQFRFKLIHKILPTNENLFTWKILDSPRCMHCNGNDTLEHFFITCPYLKSFWTTLSLAFRQIGIHNSMQSINRIAIGYKTQYKQYHDVNNILSYIGFCIYKSHMISEKRTKFVNILNIFQDETSILIKFYEHSKMSHSLLYDFLNSIRNDN